MVNRNVNDSKSAFFNFNKGILTIPFVNDDGFNYLAGSWVAVV
jgi:hypothetical protein